jgi:hypothetical protein
MLKVYFEPIPTLTRPPNEPRARPGRSERLTSADLPQVAELPASMVYLTSTETRTLAGLVLRTLAPEISIENSSCPLYPGDDLYDTAG